MTDAREPDWQEFVRHIEPLRDAAERGAIAKGTQLLLALQYRELLRQRAPLPRFDEVELRCFSQNGEDGILLYLFSLLGTTDKTVVELGAGHGVECNAANLLVHHGWRGLLVDGSDDYVRYGRAFYATLPTTRLRPPTVAHAWLTVETVNAVITQHGIGGEIDLLSLDLDGMDYWMWWALDCIAPRVVVLEFNAVWGPDRAVSVPYQADFRLDTSRQPYYCGASLAAFVKLGRTKGYRLIGCEQTGFNAFFLRDGVGDDLFPEIPAAQCLRYTLPDFDWGDRRWENV